ncbi:MAG TPA: hypothetical protein VNJ08_08490 [Bacteriovoracaceae bacterium]|nr:hypothetical protein [Bacteriovoracaceae bacterium]
MVKTLKSQFNTSPYPIAQDIEGVTYTEKNANQTSFSIDNSGTFLLSPGHYSIPVMTYCMKSSNSSPEGHIYQLDQMKGKLGPIIKMLNLKALAHFSTHDIQILHWSLLAGLSYDEMNEESQKIIDQIIPEHRNELKESFLSSMEKKLDRLSELSDGKIPTLSDIPYLEGMKNFRDKLHEVGHDYDELKRLIDTSPSNKKGSETPWSKISENIYARFLTEGSFGDIGFLQISVLPETGRMINSESEKKYSLDIASLIANPNDPTIQPLSFTPLFGMGGIVAASRIAANPRAAALLIALALAAYPMNWNDFFKLEELLEDVHDKNVQKEIEKGKGTLRQEHDELEKPLKETGIISGKDKKHSKEKNGTREYRKPGGIEQLNKDFDNMPGELSKAGDGTQTKLLPDGTTVVKGTKNKHGLTLEIQPPKNDSKYPDPKIRVKVRYL